MSSIETQKMNPKPELLSKNALSLLDKLKI